MSEEGSRTEGLLLIAGAGILLLATLLHPMSADPNDSVAAFSEYAGDRLWIVSHLGQLLGVLLIAAGLIVLSAQLRQQKRDALPSLAAGGAILMAAVATFLQAVARLHHGTAGIAHLRPSLRIDRLVGRSGTPIPSRHATVCVVRLHLCKRQRTSDRQAKPRTPGQNRDVHKSGSRPPRRVT